MNQFPTTFYPEVYTRSQHLRLTDNALCLFDCIVPHLMAGAAEPNPWDEWRSGTAGIGGIRLWCVEAAVYLDNAWRAIGGPAGFPEGNFDIEFTELFLEACVTWKDGDPLIREDYITIIRNAISLRTP